MTRIILICLALLVLGGGVAFAAKGPPGMIVPGQFSVSATGGTTYKIPVVVPPGTSGMVPSLSLEYSSQGGDGIEGLGWTLSGLSSITRCPRTLAQDGVHGSVNYDSHDQFCLDGQRLILTGTSSTLCSSGTGNVYHTEVESFSRVVSCGSTGSGNGPAYFEVWTKAGQIMEFGNSVDSQVLVVSAGTSSIPPGTVRVWSVDKISDSSGNYLVVTYNCAPVSGSCTDPDRTVNGEVYPLSVNYTGNSAASVSPYNSVRFSYASRSDLTPFYQAGGFTETTVVLTDIKTYQGPNLVYDYQLTYRAGTNVLRSHLTSLKQCDGVGNCLPQTTFGWQGTTSTDISTTSSTLTNGYQIVPGDWDANGLTDFAQVGYNCLISNFPVFLGQSSFGFSSSGYTLNTGMPSTPYCSPPQIQSTVLAPDGTSNQLISEYDTISAINYIALATSAGAISIANATNNIGVSFVAGDFNGDGIPDYFSFHNPTSHAYLGPSFGPDGGVVTSGSIYLQGADFDGDGCADILSQNGSGGLYLNYAWDCNPVQLTATGPNPGYTAGPQIVGDFNGDGKTDIIVTSGFDEGLWLSTGTGFTLAASFPPGSILAVGDWNGDGKADLLTSAGSAYTLYLSTGSDFVQALDQYNNPVVINGPATANFVVADWDNNGNSDILQQDITYGDNFNLVAYAPELMTSVSNGIDATTTIAYSPINKGAPFYTKGSSTYPTEDLIGPQYVVSEVDASNGLGTCNPASSYTNCYRVTYTYAGAKQDLQGRGFLGFSQIAASNLQTNIVQTTNYNTTFPYIGLTTSETSVYSGTVTLSSSINTYADNGSCDSSYSPPASGVAYVCLLKNVLVSNDLNNAPFPTTTTDYESYPGQGNYDLYGNTLTVNISVSGGSTKDTTNTYSNDTTNWFLGRLLTTSVNSIVGSSNMTRQSSFAYSATTGLLTQESIEPGVSTCNAGSDPCELDTSYTYDAFGHRVTTTVFGPGITTRTGYAFYDSLGQFQTSDANALGQYEFWSYDARFGNPNVHTGPNFLTTSWAYDTFGRVTQEVRPDGTQTNQSYAYCTGGCPAYGQFYSRSEIDAPGGSPQVGPVVFDYYDMLSREIANDNQGFDGSNIRVATVYDGNERVMETSRPYFVASASPEWVQFSYDDLGRALTETFPDSSVATYGYNGLSTTVQNNLSQVTTTLKNAQGLNYQVTDAASNATTYIYDAFGDLQTVTDPNGNSVLNNYDIRGNKIASRDPDMGHWTYAYDVLAELTSQVDAKAQITALTYDVLGRALTRTEPGLYSAWTYGSSSGAHNIGQLSEAKACTSPVCSTLVSDRTYSFDGTGRQVTSILQTPTDYFGYRTTYNTQNGKIASLTYPSGYVVDRVYNNIGFLVALTGVDGEPIWQANARDAESHLTSQTAGNGVLTNQVYDPATGLIQHQRAGSAGAVASFDYTFDTIGNLAARTDNNESFTEHFCYDAHLNRLTAYNVGSVCTGGTTAAYDAIGNITSKSDAGTYSYSSAAPAGPHAVTSITGTVDGLTNPHYAYDANGNLFCVSTNSGCSGTVGRTLDSTSFNMAQSVAQGSGNLALTYDDQHQRIRQYAIAAGTSTETVYINDAATGAMSERVTTSGTTATQWNTFNWGTAPWGGSLPNAAPTFVDYITVDGQIVAQRTVQYPSASAWGAHNWAAFTWGAPAGNLWNSFNWGAANWSGNVVSWAYFNLDHLGSVAVITDQGGNVVQRLSFDPWGKQRNPNGTAASCGTITSSTTRGFTNQEQMPAQCLVNLNARVYDASIGKFMAPDIVVSDPYNGQSFNRYAYVLNNPLSFTDPTGHAADLCDEADDSGCSNGPYNAGAESGGLAAGNNPGGQQGNGATAPGTSPPQQSGKNQSDQIGAAPAGVTSSVDKSNATPGSDNAANANAQGETLPGETTRGSCYGPCLPVDMGTSRAWSLPVDVGGWYGLISTSIGSTGLISSIGEYSSGSATLGTNLRLYTSGWGGNQYVDTFKLAESFHGIGTGLTVGSAGLDLYAYNFLPNHGGLTSEKFTLNLVFDLASFTGPGGAVLAAGYYLIDNFYPGGLEGLGKDYSNSTIGQARTLTEQVSPISSAYLNGSAISFHPEDKKNTPIRHGARKQDREIFDPYDLQNRYENRRQKVW